MVKDVVDQFGSSDSCDALRDGWGTSRILGAEVGPIATDRPPMLERQEPSATKPCPIPCILPSMTTVAQCVGNTLRAQAIGDPPGSTGWTCSTESTLSR